MSRLKIDAKANINSLSEIPSAKRIQDKKLPDIAEQIRLAFTK